MRIEVTPPRATLKPGDASTLQVQAHYSDGRTEDVTRWAIFTSADATVATVDDTGKIRVVGRGEGAIVVWFSSQLAIARVTVPYDYEIAPTVFTTAPRRNFIDELVLKQLQRLNLAPSPQADDATFIRRATMTRPAPSQQATKYARSLPTRRPTSATA
ncbi:MAG: hypothetical protein HC814_08380 [Rhodobacteraceae bacterium]|nr:hypothetical protein [Paracoccaceae bacterium]